MNIKRSIHVEMNRKFTSKKQRSDFLYKITGKYHVWEMRFAECKKVLWHIRQLKTVRKSLVSHSVWAKLNRSIDRRR